MFTPQMVFDEYEDRLKALRRDNEELRTLLREALQQIPITHARHEILRDRINTVLARGEKPPQRRPRGWRARGGML